MNSIGIGIFCFGDEYYYKGTLNKISHILKNGYSCYILTDNINFFKKYNVITIEYNKGVKSYHDKMLLCRYILEKHDICILLDADLHIIDYNFLHIFKDYNFKRGISYPYTLKEHKSKIKFVKELPLYSIDWCPYTLYVKNIYPNFEELTTIWENFLIFNKNGFNDSFYKNYNELQIIKENIDIRNNKKIKGNGEGVSIMVSAKMNNINIQQDIDLYNLIKDKVVDISKKFTPEHLWTDFMK